MAFYTDIYNLTQNVALRNRVTVAVSKAAQDVGNESLQTANHAQRVLWANRALVDPEGMGARMLWGVVANSNVQIAETSETDPGWRDAKVQEAINGLIDTFAALETE